MSHYPYWKLIGPAALILVGFLMIRYWSQLGIAKRWVVHQYSRLLEAIHNLIVGYASAGLAEIWLNVLHWPAWLLIVFSIIAVVYGLVSYALQSRRDLDREIKRMLRNSRSTIQGLLFLFATAGIGWLYVWVRWILTHEVR